MKARTARLFLLGAGFSKPAGLPLATELLPAVNSVARDFFRSSDFSHIEEAQKRYRSYLAETSPGREFDLEDFGAWLDWEHTLRLKGSDTWSEIANREGLQLRWAIGKVLHDSTPTQPPALYREFAQRLTTSDTVMTLNYDRVLEDALDEVGLPYRRFPHRSLEADDGDYSADANRSDELVLAKLHGSIDWTFDRETVEDFGVETYPLVEDGPDDDALRDVRVIQKRHLDAYYSNRQSWWKLPPNLLPPSTAKPLARSNLVPLWEGIGLYAYLRGGFTVIGCSLPRGDPYVLQLVHHVATDYAAGRRKGGAIWPQRRMVVIDRQLTAESQAEFRSRYGFFDPEQTDFIFDGLDLPTIERHVGSAT